MLSRRVWLSAGIAGCFALSVAAGPLLDRVQPRHPRPEGPNARSPQRIVSLAPSVTEILFELGLGDRVVGVTRYCRFPIQARELPEVGGLLDPNYEAVLRLHPDLVVELVEHQRSLPGLSKLGLRRLAVCHQDLEGIFDSITTIGRACGAEQRAEHLRERMETRLHEIEKRTAGRPQPAVLVVADRTWGAGRIEDAYVAGNDGHLNRAVRLAGGRNVAASSGVPFPVVSPEMILRLEPEVIIDLVPEQAVQRLGRKRIRHDWQALERVPAVAAGCVFVVADDRAVLPGPNVVRLVERLARLFHPELDWEQTGEP